MLPAILFGVAAIVFLLACLPPQDRAYLIPAGLCLVAAGLFAMVAGPLLGR